MSIQKKTLNYSGNLHSKIIEIKKNLDLMTENCSHPSLIGGMSGISFFNFLLYKTFREKKYKDDTVNTIFKAVNLFNQNPSDGTFANGILGIGWLIQLLNSEKILSNKQSAILEQIDFIAHNCLQVNIDEKIYDSLYGVIGTGQYYLLRDAKNKKFIEIEIILQFLDSIAIRHEKNICWPNFFSVEKLEKHQICHDFGLAHGNPSIIMFLLKVYKLGIKKNLCRELIIGSINWITEFRKQEKWQFPFKMIDKTVLTEAFRMGWCYGDLGIALAFQNAGIILSEMEIFNLGLDIGIKTTEFNVNNSGLAKLDNYTDTGFCHGTSGLAHMYSAMFMLTDIKLFDETKTYWLNQTLNNNKYLFMHYDDETGISSWHESSGLLEGISGVGSVLLSEFKTENAFFLGRIFQTTI